MYVTIILLHYYITIVKFLTIYNYYDYRLVCVDFQG